MTKAIDKILEFKRDVSYNQKDWRGTGLLVDANISSALDKCNWHMTTKGYIEIRKTIKGKARSARLHRLIIGAKHGQQVDHINGNKLDNRKCNLRIVNNRDNSINRKVHREGKLAGSSKHTNGLWRSRISINNKEISLGYFKTEEEAHLSYLCAKEGVNV